MQGIVAHSTAPIFNLHDIMKNISLHVPGFPRIGAQRELKFALEACWRGDSDPAQLAATAATLRARHWAAQRDAGLDFVTVGDFALYDGVANHIQLLGCEPARFAFGPTETPLQRYFIMARGRSGRDECSCGSAHSASPALEMTKWFDTNYHYLVPEFTDETAFSLASERLFDEVAEAQALGHAVKVALIGPLTFLWLGKGTEDKLALLERLLPVYGAILARLKALGVAWVQLDEPILGLDLPAAWRNAFEPTYWQLNQAGAPLLLATYFSPLEENLSLACRLPVAGLHVDGVRSAHELINVADWLPAHKVLSVGIVDGRNIWRTDLDGALAALAPVLDKRAGALWLSTSCSLLHVPYSLAPETGLDSELKRWLAFALEKLDELALLRAALLTPDDATVQAALAQARAAIAGRRASARVHDAAVAARLADLTEASASRPAPFAERRVLQQSRLNLPAFPTTTIGSFPQTPQIRAARAARRRDELDELAYAKAMRAEIAHAIGQQEMLGLDVLVHGEAERNDMVEYFGEQLDGFAFTANGWVQSYGSRCVKPPVIWGDVSRPAPMTVDWAVYAQGLTERPVKGMLTGPVTILQWSFVRNDQMLGDTARQVALALRDELADLEAAGIGIIQVDEPALRELLPLRKADQGVYLDWSVGSFRLATAGVREETQVHTHLCYSEFGEIIDAIDGLDADVTSIEAARSKMEILPDIKSSGFARGIGPGVYDIHSPRVPSEPEVEELLRAAAASIPGRLLWVNPDCGLKTRGYAEVNPALKAMVDAAKAVRATL